MTRANWKFTNEVDNIRGNRLLQVSSFEEVIELFSDCKVEPMWWEPATSSYLKGSYRASFKLIVS